MIATIEGLLASKEIRSCGRRDDGGIGIEVCAPYSTIEKLNSERVFLHTRLVVREDSLTLYGFATTG